MVVIFYAYVQTNFTNQTNRIIMVILMSVCLLFVLISTYFASKIDPVDPLIVESRNNNREFTR